ncbi:MAG: hypothetical protein OEQ53_08820 [Saprospiraceae bacterium]|nr:hypothetical protein [Saprospiraceae bacterium]
MRSLLIALIGGLIFGCAPPAEQAAADPDPSGYSIASQEFVDITKDFLTQMAAFDFEAWGEVLADDVEYYFPDGDQDTRTKLIGKEAVLGWWNNWKSTSGVESMTIGSENVIPIHSTNVQSTTGLAGTYTLAWFTTGMSLDNGNSTSFRMNMDMHYNDAKKIDRIFTYYDRSGIIKAMGINILDSPEEVM